MKIFKYILPVLLITALLGCKKELDSEGVSKITYYPDIKLAGKTAESVIVGNAYTDPGAKAYENGVEIPVKVTGSVNSNALGGYIIIYSATNKDGYSATKFRVVGVITSDVLSDDFSGQYKRNAGAKGVATWTKVADGVYLDSDVGGANTDGSVYVVNIKKNIVVVPHQPFAGSGSDTYCDDGSGNIEVAFTFGNIGDICYKWKVINSGYGPAVRSFVRIK